MSSHSRSFKLMAFVSAASAAALSSCSLPPDQAWRKIKDDGLISYWSYEMGTPSSQTNRPTSSQPAATNTHVAQATVSPINQPGMMDMGKPLTAQSIASLPGFVRSPYTTPPRLVDVKGSTPGATMICPYTQRPFVIPSDFVNAAPDTMIADSTPSQRSTTQPSTASNKPAENLPKVVVNNRSTGSTQEVAPSEKPKSNPSTASSPATTPAPTEAPSSNVAAAPAPKPVQEIPFGASITGRPGFVNSPFAAKHQLVDVTGLPTGMEVKCPYTGKLFRVPPQDVASSKPATTAPLSSPEEQKK